jgi:L-threonylcarbamoyladenylate synthase
MQTDWKKAKTILENDGVAILPTDTLYGLISSAFSKKGIEKIYKIKNRDKSKPVIVLISSVDQLKDFGIKGDFLKVFQPKVSILLECKSNKFKYIHRGTGEIAFRLINKRNKNLYDLLNKVGPIVAPSANREGEKPAEKIKEAKGYFGNSVDYYIDGGKRVSEPSTLIRIKNENIEILRQGIIEIKNKS